MRMPWASRSSPPIGLRRAARDGLRGLFARSVGLGGRSTPRSAHSLPSAPEAWTAGMSGPLSAPSRMRPQCHEGFLPRTVVLVPDASPASKIVLDISGKIVYDVPRPSLIVAGPLQRSSNLLACAMSGVSGTAAGRNDINGTCRHGNAFRPEGVRTQMRGCPLGRGDAQALWAVRRIREPPCDGGFRLSARSTRDGHAHVSIRFSKETDTDFRPSACAWMTRVSRSRAGSSRTARNSP